MHLQLRKEYWDFLRPLWSKMAKAKLTSGREDGVIMDIMVLTWKEKWQMPGPATCVPPLELPIR